jgi:hypothetical protein
MTPEDGLLVDKEQLQALSRPRKLCMNCNAPIDMVERHPSVVKASDTQLERYDYCSACWEHVKDEVFDSFWMARREQRRRVPKLSRRQRSVALRALFESLRERQEEDDQDARARLFLIAHLLMKWGGLRWRENLTGVAPGDEVIVFEDPLSGERHEIASVSMDDAALARVKAEVEDFLRQCAPEEDEIAL